MMFEMLSYLGIFYQAAIVLGFACVLASTAWGIVETKPRKSNTDYF